ncbi:MAG TPA: RdgB/HAM1 family non-canonical purine NTP pyrophosphatase [Planctomycetota bacterium]|nr:RdgB/HAM1 family non-canonical purine NTP pyrophosphatase [Planctomycetota bacterium]
MKRLYLGTKNQDKLREIEEILLSVPLELRALPEDAPEVDESGTSLEENARKKALEYADHVRGPVLADDTGLFVDALDGAPGIKAARYAGEKATYADNRKKLVEALRGVPKARRTARFRCVIALARPGSVLGTFEGAIEGEILDAPRGEGAFGYDPLFLVPEIGRTLAEIPATEKNRLSHRARALQRAKAALLELI